MKYNIIIIYEESQRQSVQPTNQQQQQTNRQARKNKHSSIKIQKFFFKLEKRKRNGKRNCSTEKYETIYFFVRCVFLRNEKGKIKNKYDII